jgi:hypothetical protein
MALQNSLITLASKRRVRHPERHIYVIFESICTALSINFLQAESTTVNADSPSWRPTKPTLFDVPLSPFGARIRYYIYAYGLEEAIDIKAPSELGGLQSEEYRALHPAAKMPLLVLPSGQAIPESTVRI